METVSFLSMHISHKTFGIIKKPSKVVLLSNGNWTQKEKHGSLAQAQMRLFEESWMRLFDFSIG